MPADPARGFPLTPDDQQAAKLRELEARVRHLEAGAPTIQAAAGAPTLTPRSGTPYVDETTARLYLRVGGAWRYVALT